MTYTAVMGIKAVLMGYLLSNLLTFINKGLSTCVMTKISLSLSLSLSHSLICIYPNIKIKFNTDKK